jgi:hypothetical protein
MSYFTRHLIGTEEINFECDLCGVYSEELTPVLHISKNAAPGKKVDLCPTCLKEIKAALRKKDNENNV